MLVCVHHCVYACTCACERDRYRLRKRVCVYFLGIILVIALGHDNPICTSSTFSLLVLIISVQDNYLGSSISKVKGTNM